MGCDESECKRASLETRQEVSAEGRVRGRLMRVERVLLVGRLHHGQDQAQEQGDSGRTEAPGLGGANLPCTRFWS